jgi:hypothetical protein
LTILGDVAPYSREYTQVRAVVEKQSAGDLELRSRYQQIVEQVSLTKESTLQVGQRRFDASIDKIEGTIKSASSHGVDLSMSPAESSTSASSAAPWPISRPMPWASPTR